MLCRTSLVWLRFFRRKIYPWTTLAIAACKIPCACRLERTREIVRLMVALTRIDAVAVCEFLNDLLW
mgnify:CR=1 FL=1